MEYEKYRDIIRSYAKFYFIEKSIGLNYSGLKYPYRYFMEIRICGVYIEMSIIQLDILITGKIF